MMDRLNELSFAWAEYFGAAVIQNTAFLGLVFLALYVIRNASAQARYVVASIGLLKLLLPPFVPLPTLTGSAAQPSLLAQSVATLVPSQATSAGAVSAEPAGPAIVSMVFVAWLAVFVGYVVYAAFSTLRIMWVLRDATPMIDPAVASACDGRITVLRSEKIVMPLTVGVLPKKVFVPAAWADWPADFRTAVMRHEVAHIARYDGLVQSAQTLAQALYFFHPLVWTLNRRLRTYREMACDDSSVGSERFSRINYSRHLLEIVETSARDPLACESVSALMRRKNELLARVRYQMKEGVMRRVPARTLAVVLIALASCMVPLSWYVGSTAPEPTTATAKKTSANLASVDVHVKDAETVVIDTKKTSVADLNSHVRQLIPGDPAEVVIRIRCADDTPMKQLFKIQGILLDAGFHKVKYEDHAADGVPLVLPSKHLEKRMRSISHDDIADVYVGPSGKIVFDDRKVHVGRLSKLIDQRLQENQHLIVSIHTEPDATYSDFITVLRKVKQANAQRIFINQPAP